MLAVVNVTAKNDSFSSFLLRITSLLGFGTFAHFPKDASKSAKPYQNGLFAQAKVKVNLVIVLAPLLFQYGVTAWVLSSTGRLITSIVNT